MAPAARSRPPGRESAALRRLCPRRNGYVRRRTAPLLRDLAHRLVSLPPRGSARGDEDAFLGRDRSGAARDRPRRPLRPPAVPRGGKSPRRDPARGVSVKAVRIGTDASVSVVEVPVPRIGPGEALLRTRACGICGSDLLGWYGRKKA